MQRSCSARKLGELRVQQHVDGVVCTNARARGVRHGFDDGDRRLVVRRAEPRAHRVLYHVVGHAEEAEDGARAAVVVFEDE